MFFWPIRLAFKLISLLVLLAIAYLIYSGVEVVRSSSATSNASALASASAIVVLPAPLAGTTPGPDLVARLTEAAALYRAGRAPTIVVSGPPKTATSPAGSAVARQWLIADGLPASAIVTVRATDAANGLSRAAAVLADRKKVIVVTDAIDALWTKDLAAADGLHSVVAPPPSSKKAFFTELGPLWRETSGDRDHRRNRLLPSARTHSGVV
jgi:uncharacterized SAM-binding protein YcdF (DUF218 family)